MVNELSYTKLRVIESVIPAPFRALSRIGTESFSLFQSFRLDRNLSSKGFQTSWNDKNKIGNDKQNKNPKLSFEKFF